MQLKRKPLVAAVTTVLTISAANATEPGAPADARAAQLDTVTATRSERRIDEVAATVTVQGREELDRGLPADDADLFRNDPDVALPRDLRRFGAKRVNIRGVDDNRVRQMVDVCACSIGTTAAGRPTSSRTRPSAPQVRNGVSAIENETIPRNAVAGRPGADGRAQSAQELSRTGANHDGH